MASINGLLKEIKDPKSNLSEAERKSAEKKLIGYTDALDAALSKLREETVRKKKKIEENLSKAKKATKETVASEKKKTAENKTEIEANARVKAKANKLKGIYMGLGGDELSGDELDYLEMAKSRMGREESELKETVYSLEQKEAEKEKEAAAEKKNADEAERLERERLVEETRTKLNQLAVEIRGESSGEQTEGSLSESEITALCNSIIKNGTYKGTAYRSLVIREFMLMRDSGKFTAADIERVKNRLYITDEELK